MADTAAPVVEFPAASTIPKQVKRRSGLTWLWRLALLLVVLLIAGIWFAPAIVAATTLRQQVSRILFPTYPGNIEIGSATLGWLSPVVVQNLRAEDAEGHVLLEVKEFSTRETLLSLATRSGKLGRLRLVEPVVSVSFRQAGSNLEDVLAKLMEGPAVSRVPSFELEVVDARVNLEYKTKSLNSTFEPVSLILTSSDGEVDELEMTIGKVPSNDEPMLAPPNDWLAARYGSQPVGQAVAMTVGSKQIRLKSQGWKLDRLLPALARFEPDAELLAELDANVTVQIQPPQKDALWSTCEWTWDGDVSVRELLLAGMSSLNRDRVSLKSVTVSGHVARQAERLSMENVRLVTDVGELTATGQVPLAGLDRRSAVEALQTILSDDDYQIQGHLDLKQLATLLPQTLRVREGTEITGGRVELRLGGAESDGARHWTGLASVAGLTAVNAGQSIEWKEPLSVQLQAHRRQDVTTVERLSCQSDFLTVTGHGTLTDAQFTATGDLNRLASNLNRFIDLGVKKLAGRLNAQGTIRREEADRATLAATVQLEEFEWGDVSGSTWHEPHLELSLNASGQTENETRLKQLDTAELRLTSGSDLLAARLVKAIDLNDKGLTWPVACTLTGELSSWQTRLKPFVSLTGWQLGGQAQIELSAIAGPQAVEVSGITGDIEHFVARSADWFIKESQLKLESSGIWKKAERTWSSPETTATGTALSCRIDKFLLAMNEKGDVERMSGEADFRGDLDKLSRWKNDALERPMYHMLGAMTGRATLAEHDSITSLDFDTTIESFVVADLESQANQQLHWVALWREPQLRLIGRGNYDRAADRLKLDTAELQSSGLGLTTSGSLDQCSTQQKADLTGELAYDWELLNERFGESLKKSLQVRGKAKRPLVFQGSLASLSYPPSPSPNAVPPGGDTQNGESPASGLAASDLSGQAGLGWDSATLEGLAVGPGDVSVRLDRGICQFAPIDVTIGEGKLHFTPQVRFDQIPSMIVLPREKVIDQVRLSPEVCSSWLKFVAPLLANATQVDGKFSLDVTGGALPLNSPASGQLAGAMSIHHAHVRPGPLAQQIVSLVDQIQSIIQQRPPGGPPRDRVLMEMPEQSVGFKLASGRVHHEPVTFVIGDVIVRSSGSVGTDESLDVVLQIPMRDEWTSGNRLLAKLKGQSLQMPLRGTLSRPQIDGRVLGELTKMVGGSALEGLLEDKVDDLFKKKLNQLFPGQK